MNWTLKFGLAFALAFATCGVAVSCVDMKDHWPVSPTQTPAGGFVQPSDESLSINEAKREVQVIRDDVNRWIAWRNADILKQEQKVAFIEGAVTSGLTAIWETAPAWAGGFAPLATLGIGYLIKRRNDVTPEEYRAGKEDSYNAGLKLGRELAALAAKELGHEAPAKEVRPEEDQG